MTLLLGVAAALALLPSSASAAEPLVRRRRMERRRDRALQQDATAAPSPVGLEQTLQAIEEAGEAPAALDDTIMEAAPMPVDMEAQTLQAIEEAGKAPVTTKAPTAGAVGAVATRAPSRAPSSGTLSSSSSPPPPPPPEATFTTMAVSGAAPVPTATQVAATEATTAASQAAAAVAQQAQQVEQAAASAASKDKDKDKDQGLFSTVKTPLLSPIASAAAASAAGANAAPVQVVEQGITTTMTQAGVAVANATKALSVEAAFEQVRTYMCMHVHAVESPRRFGMTNPTDSGRPTIIILPNTVHGRAAGR